MSDTQRLIRQTLTGGIITIIICTLCYYYIDRTLLLSMNTHLKFTVFTTAAQFISAVFDPHHWIIILAILLVLCFVKAIQNQTKNSWIVWLLSLLFAVIITTIIKFIVARYRPELFLHDGLYGFHGFSHKHKFNSFPSGHTALAFSGLLGLAYILKKKKTTILCIMLAIIIALSRLLSYQHYLSDVIGGIYIGILSFLWAKHSSIHIISVISNKIFNRK